MRANVLTDRREVAEVIRETLARELAPAIRAAVQKGLEGVDLTEARQAAARRAQDIEQREAGEAASSDAEQIHQAQLIAARTIAENLPHVSGGGGYPRPVSLQATGLWGTPIEYVPSIGNWRERR